MPVGMKEDPPAGLPASLRWLFQVPPGTHLDAGAVREIVAGLLAEAPAPAESEPARSAPVRAFTWRERLWVAPAETRIGRAELLEAVGKTESWLYRHTAEKRKAGMPRIPHRKLDGELVFVVGEVRAWLREHEEIVEAGPMESTPDERRGALRAV